MASGARPLLLGSLAVLALVGAGIGARSILLQQNQQVLSELERQRALIQHLSERVATVDTEHSNRPLAAPAQVDSSRLAGEVAREVGDALAQRSQAAQRASEAEAEAEHAPSAESLVAFDAASQTLTQILSTKRWTDQDKQTMRMRLSGLNGEQHVELLKRMAIAVNDGKIAIETQGPPL